jgi:chromosome segregation ATPase
MVEKDDELKKLTHKNNELLNKIEGLNSHKENYKIQLDATNLSIIEKDNELKKMTHENNELLNKIGCLNSQILNLNKLA